MSTSALPTKKFRLSTKLSSHYSTLLPLVFSYVPRFHRLSLLHSLSSCSRSYLVAKYSLLSKSHPIAESLQLHFS